MSATRDILLSRDLPSDKGELAGLVRDVGEIREGLGLDETQFHNFMIAFTEAVTNAIIHGNKSNPAKRLRLQIERLNSGVRCVVEDQGEGFDEGNVANPVSPGNLLAESGRGVFIIRALMNEVFIENTGKGTRITFTCLPE